MVLSVLYSPEDKVYHGLKLSTEMWRF